MLIDMDARGNKLSSCKIPDQYLKKQKSYQTFRTLTTLTLKGMEWKKSEIKSVKREDGKGSQYIGATCTSSIIFLFPCGVQTCTFL